MKLQFSRKQLRKAIIILLLIIVGTSIYLIQEGFWVNINSQGMIRLAKENWANGEYLSSINWYCVAYSSALQGGVRLEIFKIYNYRIGVLRKQGNLSKALDVCWQATKIWNQEGATSFECAEIKQEMLSQK